MISANDRLANIVSQNIDLLPIVFRFDISSNIGQGSIGEICIVRGIDVEFFLSVINTYNSYDYFPNIDTIDLNLLTNFLIKTHEYHKKNTIPRLQELIKALKIKVVDKKLVITLESYLNDYIKNLLEHIDFEEKHIFPLVLSAKRSDVAKSEKRQLINLKKLFGQHSNVETEISDLIMVIIQHIPENSNIQLFYDILHTLSHFEKEQIDHARFEDKILVPRLLTLLAN